MTVILRLPAVKERTGLSRSSIYAYIARGTFPAPVSLGVRAVGWNSESIDAWIAARIEPGCWKKVEVTSPVVQENLNTSGAPATDSHPFTRFGVPGLRSRRGMSMRMSQH